jgi:hypothetical protein
MSRSTAVLPHHRTGGCGITAPPAGKEAILTVIIGMMESAGTFRLATTVRMTFAPMTGWSLRATTLLVGTHVGCAVPDE